MAERLSNSFQFLDVDREDPDKKSLDIRKSRFVEIYEPYQEEQVKDQAHRCLACGNPYCEWKCPVHNYIPNWLQLVSDGNLFAAVALHFAYYNFCRRPGKLRMSPAMAAGVTDRLWRLPDLFA